jgi:hypothetical protein
VLCADRRVRLVVSVEGERSYAVPCGERAEAEEGGHATTSEIQFTLLNLGTLGSSSLGTVYK